jgi:hypothetical protein
VAFSPDGRRIASGLQKVRQDWPVVEIAGAGHINCIFKKQFRDELTAWVRKNSH